MDKVLRLFALPLLIAGAMPALTESSREVLTLGTLEDGVYHHNRTGIQFAVPSGWVIVTKGTSSSGGQAVTLRDAETNGMDEGAQSGSRRYPRPAGPSPG